MDHHSNSRLVYSDPAQKQPSVVRPKRALVRLERKGRSGKTVTVIERLALSDETLKKLLQELQRACGTGGTVKEHHLELQGDFCNRAREFLKKRGFAVS